MVPAGQEIGDALFNHTALPCRYLGNPQPRKEFSVSLCLYPCCKARLLILFQ